MIYITYERSVIDAIGINKKVMAQYRVFKQAFQNAFYTLYSGQMMHLFKDNKLIEKELAMTKKECNGILIKWMAKYGISKSYIRYDLADKSFIEFLKQQAESGIKSVLEFPTVPYEDSYGNRIMVEDAYYRDEMHKYIKRCTTYSDYKEVFQIPCIPIVNGVDITEHKEKRWKEKSRTLTLLAVATFATWHGYERILQGLKNYYANGGERNIIFNIAGNGGQIQYYRKLTDEYQLQDHVVFHGQLHGEKLDKVYDDSDIAIGSLGFYKAKLQSGAPIKLREYCARGIPFIYGYHDISFDENNYFAYQVTNDASPIDMYKVIDFYEKVYDERNCLQDMRKYAAENLTWNNILQPVINYLN